MAKIKENTDIKDTGFKLLAIRPMEGCHPNIRKNLKEGILYKFYNDYTFTYENDDEAKEVNFIKHNPTIPESLYRIGDVNLNISAVVGENGSGKSSLIELLYLANYLIGEKNDILYPSIIELDKRIDKIDKIDKENKTKELKEKTNLELRQNYFDEKGFIEKLREQVKVELFYQIEDNNYLCVRINDGITQELIKGNKLKERNYKISDILNEKIFDFKEYFYTIAINYSLYGLNELDDFWLKPLFHKNDAYKTPIVINPYRDEGNIEINSELHLAQTRTLLNLSSKQESNPEIVNSKKISKVKFLMDIENNNHINITWNVSLQFKDVMKKHTETHGHSLIELFNQIALKLAGLNLPKSENEDLYKYIDLQQAIELTDKSESLKGFPVDVNRVKFEMIKYAVRKIFKICIQYSSEYGTYIEKKVSNPPVLIITNLDGLLKKIKSDKSHLTLKLRQIIYSIFSNYLFQENKWTKIAHEKNSYSIEFEWKELSDHITKSEDRFDKYLSERMEVIPAAFLKPIILISNDRNVKHKFSGLSSGEQQLANAIQTVIYHLYNLNSVHQSSDKNRLKYKHINIVFDEIELYFHPEFQRKFIDELLKSIKQLSFEEGVESINILFSTHSPFILSDIPSSNILRLKDGSPEVEGSQTFGANIHDLLAKDFFLGKGFMGEFAKNEINNVIEFLNKTHLTNIQSENELLFEKVDKKVKARISLKLKEVKDKLNKIGELNKKYNKEHCKGIIELTGEPMLYMSLMELYTEVFKSEKDEFINSQIERLEKLKRE